MFVVANINSVVRLATMNTNFPFAGMWFSFIPFLTHKGNCELALVAILTSSLASLFICLSCC